MIPESKISLISLIVICLQSIRHRACLVRTSSPWRLKGSSFEIPGEGLFPEFPRLHERSAVNKEKINIQPNILRIR
jgi:hypothetical protein